MANKERLEKSHRNAEQTALILTDNPNFQQTIAILRMKWHINKHGEDKKSGTDWQNWFRLAQDSYQPSEGDKDLELARQKRILTRSLSGAAGIMDIADKNALKITMRQAFYNDIGRILINHNLSPRWFRYVQHKLLYGENVPVRVPSGVEFQLAIDEMSGQEIILLKITDEITKDDLVAAIGTIKKYQKQLPYYDKGKVQPKPMLERNRAVAEKFDRGESVSEIIDYLEEHWPRKGGYNEYSEIYKMAASYRKLTEINQY